MDDIKLYGRNDKELERLLCTIKKCSDNIGMAFGIDKCAKAAFIMERLASTSGIKLNEDTSNRELDQEEHKNIQEQTVEMEDNMPKRKKKDLERVLQTSKSYSSH